jgi:hypothetical protein
MEDPREERSDVAAKAAEVHEDHEASVNQVGDQPFPASHDDDAADREDSADSSQD